MLKYTQCYTRLDLSAYFTYICIPSVYLDVYNATTDTILFVTKKNYHRREKIPKTPK